MVQLKKLNLTHYIFIGLILGVIIGHYFNTTLHTAQDREVVTDNLSIISEVFLHLIKLIISPLVLCSIIIGIAKLGYISSLLRIGIKTIGLFILSSLISLTAGLIMVNILRPGDAMVSITSHMHNISYKPIIQSGAMSIKTFILEIFPQSIVGSMANNNILQVVVFSLLFATGLMALGKKGEPLIEILEIIFHSMLNITNYVMKLAPLAVFASVTTVVTQNGLSVLGVYGKFMLEFYLTVIILLTILISLAWLILRNSTFKLLNNTLPAIILAFTTSSSESAYPKVLNTLENFGVSNKTAAFVLPIGYSFNLTGSMIYCSFATIFIAQAFQINLPIFTQLTILSMLMLTSKGMAGVPRASLVVVAATLVQFKIPQEGLVLLLAVDHFLDMARSATNVIGNALSCAIVSKWEKEI